MKRKFFIMLSLLSLLSMVISACGGATEAPVIEEPPVAEGPAVEEAEPEVMAVDLDGAFDTFLAGMEGYNTVKMDALAEELLEEPPPFLLDVRTVAELEENGHIPGAVNIPLNELGQHLDLLPNFDTPIVTYCAGGWRATIAMTQLSAAGWTDVRALKAKFSDWVDAGYAVEPGVALEAVVLNAASPDPTFVSTFDAVLSTREGWGGISTEDLNLALTDNPDLYVIDVRRVEEVDEKGVIEAANFSHIPLEEFIAQIEMWPADLDTTITVYCGSGHRSTIAMAILWDYGYTNVTSLSGGFGGWVDAGYPVLGGPADLDTAFGTFLAGMAGYNTINMETLATELLEEPPPFVLDVRTVSEVEENGHIPGAYHIPLNELGQHLELLPSFDTPIVTYCAGGWRATIAMTELSAAGWSDVRALKAKFSDWVEAGYAVDPGLPIEAVALHAASPDPAFISTFDAVISAREGWGGISAEDLNLALTNNPDMFLIDVRRVEEVDENGVIEAANFAHIPLEEFITQIGMCPVDKDNNITVYCGSGHRSTIAMAILWTYGYTDVTSLSGGFGGWVDAGYPVAELVAQ